MLLGKTKINPPCKITYTWFTKQRNRDIDNMAFASKYINDGLVKAKLLPNDNLNNIIEVTHRFEINKKAGVRFDIEEVIK